MCVLQNFVHSLSYSYNFRNTHPLYSKSEIFFDQKSKRFGVQEKQPIFQSEFTKILNGCRTRTEIREGVRSDETWEWYDDTAVHAAIRANSSKTLLVLLKHGADPTLHTGHIDGMPRTDAFELAENSWSPCKRVLAAVREFWKYDNFIYKSADAIFKNETRWYEKSYSSTDEAKMVLALKNLDESLHHISPGAGDFSEKIQVPWTWIKPKKARKGERFQFGMQVMKNCYNQLFNSKGRKKFEAEEGHWRFPYDTKKSALKLMQCL